MNRCFACKYYDSSVDCCNGDDVCYMDGLNQGYYEAFKIFSEHCQSGHLIIGYDDQRDFRGCFLQECMIGEKGMNNEEYDRGFAQGKIKGAVEKRAEICKRLRFWADATRQINPDIAIGYDHAISLIERDFAIESSDWIVADTEDDEYGFVAEYPMDLLNIRFLAGKENFKLDRTDEELDCLWRNFSDRYYSASWIGVDTDTVWRFCKWLKN